MSRHVRSSSLWKIIPKEQEPSEPVGPVAEPREEKPEQKELPTESHDITPDQEKEDEGPPEVEVPDPEKVLHDLAQLHIGDEGRHRPVVKEAVLQKAESIYMAEAGPDLAADLQELTLPKTEGEGREVPNVKGENYPKVESIHMLEAGEGQLRD